MSAFAGILALLVGAALAASGLLAVAANAAQPPVGLGRAITGDLGSFATPCGTGLGSIAVNRTGQCGGAVTQHARNDLVTAYTGPATQPLVETGLVLLMVGSLIVAATRRSRKNPKFQVRTTR